MHTFIAVYAYIYCCICIHLLLYMHTFIAVYVHVYCCICTRLLLYLYTLSAEYAYVIGRICVRYRPNMYTLSAVNWESIRNITFIPSPGWSPGVGRVRTMSVSEGRKTGLSLNRRKPFTGDCAAKNQGEACRLGRCRLF